MKNLLTYDNVKRPRSRLKANEAAQTVSQPGLAGRKALCLVELAGNNLLWAALLWPLNFALYYDQLNRLNLRPSVRGQLWLIREESCSLRITLGHAHLWRHVRNSGSSNGKFLRILDLSSITTCSHVMARVLGETILASREACENWLFVSFANKEKGF